MPIVSVNPEARYDEAGSQAEKKEPEVPEKSLVITWDNQKEVLAKRDRGNPAPAQAPRMGIKNHKA